MLAPPGPPIVSDEDALGLRCWFGEDEMVVIVVAAVCGRSAEPFDTAAPDVGGNLPVSSSLRIRDLILSSSSQTVEGAVLESPDSLPSASDFVRPWSAADSGGVSTCAVSLPPEEAYWRFEGR